MDNLRDNYRDEEDDDDDSRHPHATLTTTVSASAVAVDDFPITLNDVKEETVSEDSDDVSDDENDDEILQTPKATPIDDEDEEDEDPPQKKHKSLSTLSSKSSKLIQIDLSKEKPKSKNGKKGSSSKKKNNNVWTKPSSRKGKKKGKSSANGNSNSNGNTNNMNTEDRVMITPIPKFIDKTDDIPDMKICLSKVYKAEKVELSDDRMSASSCKGYRMVRATRGVTEGAWYFEIRVLRLGESGHTRLGWSMEKGDLQAPVGYDANSFGYRDVDGSKVHKALREKYGEEGYVEGDVIGFYMNLPEGSLYLPKPPHLVWYRGQRYMCAPDVKEDPPKVIPGSEISFFKNGVCQGVAFKDLYGGRYYPAASMYTLPNQPNCIVRFNFGPDFECFPEDFNDRPLPRPMIVVPYHGGVETRLENGVATEKKP